MAMNDLYPDIEPYQHGMLDVGDGHMIYWEQCGNPAGKPALVLHGGPGSGCSPGARRYFDPAVYRVVLFDQRGCGRSLPHAGELEVDLSTNTTAHLLGDIEALRRHLDIEKWLVLGGSWGSTLGLAYAQRHVERVSEMVLYSIATTTMREIEWMTRGVGAFFPVAWQAFRNGLPAAVRDGDLVAVYYELLVNPSPAIHQQAARDWCDWEIAAVAVRPDYVPSPRYEDARFRLGFARLVTHYWHHKAWLEDEVLLRNINILKGVPAVLIHGRLDIGGPLVTPWTLVQNWPGSELVVVDEAGHDTRDPGMNAAIVAATDRFRDVD